MRKGEHVLMLDAGDFLGGATEEDALKTEYLVRGLVQMGIGAMNLGEMDFLRGQDFLRHLQSAYDAPLVSSNILIASTREPFVEPYRILRLGGHRWLGFEWGGVRVGVFGLLSNERPPRRTRPSDEPLLVSDPYDAAKRMIAELEPRTDFIIALSHLGLDQAGPLAERFPAIDVVVSGHGRLRLDGLRRAGETVVVHSRSEGKFIGDLALTVAKDGQIREAQAAQIALDDQIPEREELAALEHAYREAAKTTRTAAVAGPPIFAGAASCARCHADQFSDWSGSGHARALETLIAEGEGSSQACVRCHTTGFRRPGGFIDLGSTPGFAGVQCEECHGPGLGHVRFHEGTGGAPFRFRMSPGNTAADCVHCHDEDNDPDFDFDADLPVVMH